MRPTGLHLAIALIAPLCLMFAAGYAAAGPIRADFEAVGIRPGPFGINSLGVVVGQTHVDPGDGSHIIEAVAIQRPGGPVETLPIIPNTMHVISTRIIDNGNVYANVLIGSDELSFLLSPDGAVTQLGAPGFELISIAAVNQKGEFVGNTGHVSTPMAFKKSADGKFMSLGGLTGHDSYARGINNLGEVVGGAVVGFDEGYGVQHAFRWTEQDGMIDLGVLAGDGAIGTRFSSANDINDLGVIVGSSGTINGDVQQAFIYDETSGMRPLLDDASLFSYAIAINNSGWVVGDAYRDDFSDRFGFLWTPELGMIDLNSLLPEGADVNIIAALDITDNGFIVGFANVDGESTIFRMRVSAAVPAPGTGATLLLAGVAVGARRRRADQ